MNNHPEVQKFLSICNNQTKRMNELLQKMARLQNGDTSEDAEEIQEDVHRELAYNLFMLTEFNTVLKRIQNDA